MSRSSINRPVKITKAPTRKTLISQKLIPKGLLAIFTLIYAIHDQVNSCAKNSEPDSDIQVASIDSPLEGGAPPALPLPAYDNATAPIIETTQEIVIEIIDAAKNPEPETEISESESIILSDEEVASITQEFEDNFDSLPDYLKSLSQTEFNRLRAALIIDTENSRPNIDNSNEDYQAQVSLALNNLTYDELPPTLPDDFDPDVDQLPSDYSEYLTQVLALSTAVAQTDSVDQIKEVYDFVSESSARIYSDQVPIVLLSIVTNPLTPRSILQEIHTHIMLGNFDIRDEEVGLFLMMFILHANFEVLDHLHGGR